MGNKHDKPLNSVNKEKENTKEDQKKFNRILSNYLFHNKENNKVQITDKFIDKNIQPSKLSEKNFIEISSLLASQINIKALTKDLSLNFEKSLVLNSHAIQLCSMENENDNIIFENKTAILQMNSYDNKFNQNFTNNFIKKELENFMIKQRRKKEEVEFGIEMEMEIEGLKKSKKIINLLN